MTATKTTREYDFYRHLCEELITWAVGAMFAAHMNVRRRQQALRFWERLDEIADLSLESDNLALFELKRLTREVMSFYARPLRYATAPEHVGANSRFLLKAWRWDKLRKRAQNWIQEARGHDWDHDLQMQPEWAQSEDWWSPNHITSSSPYVITVLTSN